VTLAPKHHYLVPSNQVAHFIGREDILTDIESSFALSRRQSRPAALILHAMGGQGKTQVALELCRRRKPDCRAIFWINATSETTAGRDIEIISSRLNTPLKRTLDDVSSKVEFVKETLENWNEAWMMIFDNYDSPTGFENVKDFMPSSESLISTPQAFF
jgi:Cdc6-like AAA superfamily ATPase